MMPTLVCHRQPLYSTEWKELWAEWQWNLMVFEQELGDYA